MFGCSDEGGIARVSAEVRDAWASDARRARLRAHDASDAGAIESRYEALRDGRAAPADPTAASPSTGDAETTWTSTSAPVALGRTHRIPSTVDTVAQGIFDPNAAPVATIDSGDVVVYENTWTHFSNRLQPGVSADALAAMRRAIPGRGVHSIIGPIFVRGAMPGDVLQLRMLRLETIDFGANFHNPGALVTGSLHAEFAHGHVRYFDLSADDGYVYFNDRIRLALKPFQGTLGVAPAGDVPVSSVAPGRFGGNIDLKDLTAGSSLFVPVTHPGALIFTGDSHAVQADGEVNITAIETGMREVRMQVIVHKNAGWTWPFAETPTHWIALGMDTHLNEALRIALRQTIAFLHERAGLTRDESYSLASIGVDFRVTQMVNVINGVHAMIPKEIFAPDYRSTISVA
ncbi:amidase [Vulcanimicrobium alpinum]|uniref:Amidase n=1 Tax=Vulcanimicrobium alpinum TaxID=3016050 RepID=A0AAN1XTQ0_UNVUL|nr:acetamidase/formamidase family protein [Vulcanimicrobium alpinum]BDE05020.1 amidase [Vulcanimicrobium alpinum]